MKSIMNLQVRLRKCPFCHKPAYLFKEELWHGSHGYYGNYIYYVGCNNDECNVKPKTIAIDDIYRDTGLAIQESVNRWNER